MIIVLVSFITIMMVLNYHNLIAVSDRISLSNHFYERGAKFNSFVASLYSEWSDEFSTEIRLGTSSLDNRQISLDQDSGFGEIQVDTENDQVRK